MKTKFKLRMLLFSLILFTASSYGQQKKIEINLSVNVDTINQGNINETCSFGQGSGISNQDFTTDVQVGDEVKWKINRSEGSKGSAKLVRFKHDRGNKFFNQDSIPEKNGNIKATVQETAGSPGDTEKYSVVFKVKKKGENNWETYSIDPKLKLILRE